MKKLFILFILIADAVFGQSVSIIPGTASISSNIVTTPTNRRGLEHTDGTIQIQTYVNNAAGSSFYGGWLQTYSAHPLVLSTANGAPQVYLNSGGSVILNPSDGKTGNVGIGLPKLTVPDEKLVINGNVRVNNLAGSGNRPVYVNASGTLTLTPSTQSYTTVVNPASFQLGSGGVSGGVLAPVAGYGSCIVIGSNISEQIVAPVNLPAGATVTSIRAYYTDNDATYNIAFDFFKSELTNPSSENIVTLFQVTNNPQPYTISQVVNNSLSEVIDHAYTYYIAVRPTGATASSAGVWNFNGGVPNHKSVKGIVITYTY